MPSKILTADILDAHTDSVLHLRLRRRKLQCDFEDFDMGTHLWPHPHLHYNFVPFPAILCHFYVVIDVKRPPFFRSKNLEKKHKILLSNLNIYP